MSVFKFMEALIRGDEAGSPGSDHVPGLDGLRAVSVLVVMLYHAHLTWMRGGFLGVEVFFGISGFLITRRLLHDHARLDLGFWPFLGRFWKRRVGRLFPALVLFLLAMMALGAFVLGPRASQFRGDLLPSFLYFENWYQIASGGSYFADQGIPLMRHIWSLAVEEQFYILWPVLVAGILWTCRRGRGVLWLVTAGLALASLARMLQLADPSNASSVAAMESLNRVYLGTDTRAFGLLAGALLAFTPRAWAAVGRLPKRVFEAGSVAALAALLGLCAFVDIQDPFLYRGGFLLVDGLTLFLIAGFLRADHDGPLAKLLGWRPLEWIGQRSYGIYLWHWPIFRLVGEGQNGLQWVLLRWGLTFLVAGASYRWVEAPILDWVRGRPSRPVRLAGRRIWRFAAVTASLLLVGISTQAAVHLVHLPAYRDEIRESLRVNAEALDTALGTADGTAIEPHEALRAASCRIESDGVPLELPYLPPHALEGLSVTAIGDSVMKGAAVALKDAGEAQMGKSHIVINAEESRSFARAYEVVKDYKAEGRLGDVVVIHLGANNSSLPEREFNHLMALLSDRKLVLFLTVKSDKVDACNEVNTHLEELVKRVPNARLVDWKGISEDHPELFYSDQTHLRPMGARYYASHILAQIHARRGETLEHAN